MKKSAWIIILNWNGLSDTVECVRSCLELEYAPYEIVIVDNGSADGSETVLRETFPEVKVIQTGRNLGYAGGNNAGIRHAVMEGADYIWLLNNDTVAHPRALDALVGQAKQDPSIGIVGSKICCYADRSRLLYAGGRVDMGTGVTEHIGYGRIDDGSFDQTAETDYITGCSLLVKREVIENIGLMNEDYFLYFEETEWCVQAQRSGYRLIYAPQSVVYHKESATVRKFAGAMLYYLVRNRLLFLQRNGVSVKWFKRFADDLYLVLKNIFRKDVVSARLVLKAYRHWIKGCMGPLDTQKTREAPTKRSCAL